ncbi:hypothetical protein LMG26686_01311 [Achromobacter mucicolens]|uniref:pyocin knob domain-containing protein n=1 Tax=Achromobacter mucicolens TaxID=1389922 RepID=UPI0014671343|nr:pyocin knob domain-containing protein [Achromobacter mucicolens]CAB3838213.1 hypothetical protein LMG26686_01311 [Achromobacter mucicolens]
MDPLVKVNVGFSPNDGTGDALRNAFIKLNQNVDSIANAIGAAFGLATLGADARLLMGQMPVPLVLPSTLHDLNSYYYPGIYRQDSSAGAQAGANYPAALPGVLQVQGGANGVLAVQRYTIASPGASNAREFLRVLAGGGWSGWTEGLSSALMGAPGGLATLGSNGRLLQQGPFAEIAYGGTDANTLVLPGVYVVQSDANATAALNWPALIAGTMTVEAASSGNMQVTQTYTTRTGRTFKRIRFLSSGVWEAWQEQARLSDLVALGIGQSWQNVGPSRAPNTNFTNSTPKPILVMASVALNAANGRIIMYVDDKLAQDSFNPTSAASLGAQIVVPSGSTYRIVPVASAISGWWEYR